MAKMVHKNSHTFVGEMKISFGTSYPEEFLTETVFFSPLLDDSVTFYLQASRKTKHNNPDFYNQKSELDLTLLKVRKQLSSNSSSMATMNVDLKVYYSDASIFKEYTPLHDIKVDKMKALVFDRVIKEIYVKSGEEYILSEHFNKMRTGSLTALCKMTFTYPDAECHKAEISPRFTKNLKAIYESSIFNDFVINVGEKTFPVHKVILVAHSPVFMKMLTQDFQESKTNSVTIADSTPETFDLFLKYLYSGEIEDKSWPSVKALYYLADKYDVETLKNDCTDVAISIISIDFVCDILKLSYTFNASSLMLAAKKFAINNIKELISKQDWKELVDMHPMIGYEIAIHFVPK